MMLPILQPWKPRHGQVKCLAGSLISEGWSENCGVAWNAWNSARNRVQAPNVLALIIILVTLRFYLEQVI